MRRLSKGLAVTGIAIALSIAAIGAGSAEDVGAFGPPLAVKAMVVRTFTMKTSGAIKTEVKGEKGDEKTALMGLCNPATWANFGIVTEGNPKIYEQMGIYITTENPIKTGMTGDINLDKILVRFFDMTNDERRFSGRGMLKLTAHNATPGKRRMTGTIVGTKLEGVEDKLGGKFISVTANFDMDFSCGVT